MKSIKLLVLLTVALALGPWIPALAQARQGLFGTAKAINCAAGSMTVETKAGSKEVAITPETELRSPSGGAACQDIGVGDRLALLAREDAGRLTALKVMLVPGKPVHSHTVGVVSEVKDNQVTLLDTDGQPHTVQWAPGLPALQPGQVLTVVGRKEADKTIAKGVKRAEEVMEKLQKDLNQVEARLARTEEELQRKTRELEALKARLGENASRHLSVLSQNLGKAPEAARKGLENALENASKGYQQALEAVGKEVPKATLEGVISAVTRDSLVIALSGGRTMTLKVTAKTKVEVKGALMLAPGLWVEAKYDSVTLEADKVEAEAPPEVAKGEEVEVEGTIERITLTHWVIGGVSVGVTKETKIEGKPEVGRWAEAEVIVQPDGSRIAVEVKVRPEKGGKP